MLHHVSIEKVKNDIFYPRIPKNRIEGENSSIKRICFSKKIEKCITAMPNGIRKIENLIMLEQNTGLPAIAYIYEIDNKTIAKKNIISSTSLVKEKLVPDAQINQEVWVINQSVNCKRKIVRFIGIKKRLIFLDMGMDKKHFYEVKKITFENSQEPYERKFNYLALSEYNCRVITKLAKNLGCSTKKLPNLIIEVTVPSMADIALLWERMRNLRMNHMKKAYKKDTNKKWTMTWDKMLSVDLSQLSKSSLEKD